MGRPHCFRSTLTQSRAAIGFSSRILVGLLRYCVLLSTGLAVRSLLLDLDSYSGNDQHGMVPLFYKPVTGKLVPKLAAIFKRQVKGGGGGKSFSRIQEISRCCPCAKRVFFLRFVRL